MTSFLVEIIKNTIDEYMTMNFKVASSSRFRDNKRHFDTAEAAAYDNSIVLNAYAGVSPKSADLYAPD